jgi:hypothetical protein
MSPLVHQAGGVLQPLLTSSEDVRRRARRTCGIATPHTTSCCCGHENFNFSKDRHSETLNMIFYTNNTDYDFRYINISNLLQPYIHAGLALSLKVKQNEQLVHKINHSSL